MNKFFDILAFLLGKAAGGGGGDVPAGTSFTLLAEQDFEVNTVSTSEISVGTIEIPGIYSLYTEKKKWIWVLTRDKAGKQNGHYFGNDNFILGGMGGGIAVYLKSNGTYDFASHQYGIYPVTSGINQNKVYIKAKYASSFGTMSGTFNVRVYVCDYPSGVDSLY